MNLTERERAILSNGLLRLIEDASRAAGLVYDQKSREHIKKHIGELQELNRKILFGEDLNI